MSATSASDKSLPGLGRWPGLAEAVTGTLVMALASAFADALWAAAIPEHRTIYGLVHGGIVLSVMGLTLAVLVGGRRQGLAAVAGLLIGVLGAALFYVLYLAIDVFALFIAWIGVWLAFALLTNTLSQTQETGSRTATRAVVAAGASGVAFWAVSGMWLGAHDPGPFFVRNFAYWIVAFLPGFVALLLGRART